MFASIFMRFVYQADTAGLTFSYSSISLWNKDRLYNSCYRTRALSSSFGWDVKSRSLLPSALCMDSHPWLGLCLAGQVNVKSGISDWSVPNRLGCNSSGDSTNLRCDCLPLVRQSLQPRCQHSGLHSCIKTSKSNRVVYNDRFSLVSVNVRVELQWLQLERSEN